MANIRYVSKKFADLYDPNFGALIALFEFLAADQLSQYMIPSSIDLSD